MEKNYFEELNSINVSDKIEKKNGLSYLSWAFAWGELKKKYPDAFYTVYENKDGWNFHTDGSTCWVKTGVTVNGLEHIEYLPVMDFRNKSISLDAVTSFDVNKAIQRSLTKAVARHGLGLYIYAGEDLPEEETQGIAVNKKTKETNVKMATAETNVKMATAAQIAKLKNLISDTAKMVAYCNSLGYKITGFEDMPEDLAKQLIKNKENSTKAG